MRRCVLQFVAPLRLARSAEGTWATPVQRCFATAEPVAEQSDAHQAGSSSESIAPDMNTSVLQAQLRDRSGTRECLRMREVLSQLAYLITCSACTASKPHMRDCITGSTEEQAPKRSNSTNEHQILAYAGLQIGRIPAILFSLDGNQSKLLTVGTLEMNRQARLFTLPTLSPRPLIPWPHAWNHVRMRTPTSLNLAQYSALLSCNAEVMCLC